MSTEKEHKDFIIDKDHASNLGIRFVTKNSGFDPAVTDIVVSIKAIELDTNRTFYSSVVDETATLLIGRTTIRHLLKIGARNARVERISYKTLAK